MGHLGQLGHLGGGEGDLLYWLLLWGPKQQDRWFFDEPSGRLSSSYHGLHSCGSDGRLVGDRPKLGDILSTKNMKSISAKKSLDKQAFSHSFIPIYVIDYDSIKTCLSDKYR